MAICHEVLEWGMQTFKLEYRKDNQMITLSWFIAYVPKL